MKYGEMLQLYLNEMNLTGNDLARMIGCNRQSIYSLLDGRAKDPTFKRACEIADALGLTLQEMADRMRENQ